MAINPKIIKKVKSLSGEDALLNRSIPNLLARIEEGKQPKREIEKILKEIK